MLIGFARTGCAQTLGEPALQQLREKLQMGEVLIVQQDNGPTITGRLTELLPERISIDGYDIGFGHVLEIEKRDGRDSVKNGAKIGGWVLGVWCAIVCGQGTTGGGQYVLAVTTNAIIGAIIGAGIDRSHQGRETVFRQYDPLPAGGTHTTDGRRFSAAIRLSF